MQQVGDNRYGDTHAETYDALFQERDDLTLVSQVLARLAGAGPVLEFGIGTGRLALPLAQTGLKVYGIDNSAAMLERLRTKPGADQIVSVLGDCTSDRVEGSFTLVFIAFSTIYLFESQDTQVQCFQNAARHLQRGGVFVVEAFVHDRSHWHNNQQMVTTSIADDLVTLRCGVLDPAQQLIKTQQVELSSQGIKLRPNRLRFLYPAEMDLMGCLAGFRLRERWDDWSGTPLRASSTTQIAIYEKVSDDSM